MSNEHNAPPPLNNGSIDTSLESVRRLLANLNTGRTPLTLVARKPAVIPPPLDKSLPFPEQVSSLLGSPATPQELAEAMFRVNLTPGHEHIDLRPATAFSDRERLALRALAKKLTTSTAEVSLLQPTQLAIWRGLVQPLRGPA